MSIYAYKKYQILLDPDSKKTQGLQTGDIVRRQYFDGTGILYSLMCVLDYGTEQSTGDDGKPVSRPYFVGALLDGDAPQTGEILDFVRITSLYNVDRSGALYLTASDDQAPFMDIIDQLGRKASLSWPENISTDDFEDSSSQYIVDGKDHLDVSYQGTVDDCNRVVTIKRTASNSSTFEGLRQDFYQYVENPQRVLVSYKIRGSGAVSIPASLGYTDDLRLDGSWTEDVTTEWQYKLKAITVDYSGRHLRSFKLDLSGLAVGSTVQIADFNIILLSSIANFGDASTMRIGKLDGIIDPVFGQLDGYGAYLQKLYATTGAHISGTLTAGDENGYGGTFYAGKIHRNCFKNSIDINFSNAVTIDNDTVINPTGMGNIYRSDAGVEMTAQDNSWLLKHVGERYCFSVWVYLKQQGQINIQQNGYSMSTVQIGVAHTHSWYRIHAAFDLNAPKNTGDDLKIGLVVSFGESIYDEAGDAEGNPDETLYYLCGPQLEAGNNVTQYQATDALLNDTDDYGAWFARGGIGGTIQNPLLQLNYDGNGSIGTRAKSLELKQDGSGYLANKNIQWDPSGNVTFGEGVHLDWGNLTDEVKDNISAGSVSIIGEDTFTVVKQESTSIDVSSPATITLTAVETGFSSSTSGRQWYYMRRGEYLAIPNANGLTLDLDINSDYWDGESTVTFKFEAKDSTNSEKIYTDTFTVKKQYADGYVIKLTSSTGTIVKNGKLSTVITASFYYKNEPVTLSDILSNFVILWRHYYTDDPDSDIDLDATEGDAANILIVDHEISQGESYACQLVIPDYF